MKCLVDTNVISTMFRLSSLQKNKRLEYKLLTKKFEIVHNSVSLVEYGRGLESSDRILSENRRYLDSKKILYPDLKAWKLSLNLINELYKEHKNMNKIHLRKMQMDALIAGIAISTKTGIVTNDNDFQRLKELQSGRSLKVYRVSF